MRVRTMQTRMRKNVAWYLAGFFAVQFGLALGIDQCWPALRDPDFAELRRIVRERKVEAPNRRLVFVCGSSRLIEAVRAERLNHPEDAAAPIVINCSFRGGGPMLHVMLMRRWLDAGVRPDLVFLETMPMALSARNGAPLEERQPAARYSAPESGRLFSYYQQPVRLCWKWGLARFMPCHSHQAELRDALGIDVLTPSTVRRIGYRDEYGWAAGPETMSREESELRTRENLQSYHRALTQPALGTGAMRAVRDLIDLCREKQIAVVLMAPPEGTPFRSYAPVVEECQMKGVRELALEAGVPLIDARAWVDDDCFYDGHHTCIRGADQFTQRFALEALAPYAPRHRSAQNEHASR